MICFNAKITGLALGVSGRNAASGNRVPDVPRSSGHLRSPAVTNWPHSQTFSMCIDRESGKSEVYFWPDNLTNICYDRYGNYASSTVITCMPARRMFGLGKRCMIGSYALFTCTWIVSLRS